MKNVLSATVVASAVAFSGAALSHEEGDLIIRAGAATVDPDGSGGLNGTLTVDDDTQLGITGTYMFTNNLGVGVLASTPFKHDLYLVGAGKIGDTKHLPPTVTLQYHFNNDTGFTPYVGAGVNYTKFFEESSSLGDLKLDDSWGLALEAGLDWAIDENWLLSAQVWYIEIDTDAKLNGAPLTNVEIDPWVYMVGVGYKF